MLRYFGIFTLIVYLSIPAHTIFAYTDDEIEDLIDIIEAENKIIAVIKGIKRNSFNLRANETVLWSGSRGYLGALLTNLKFYVISTSSGSWMDLSLDGGESDERIVSLSPYIALLVTKDRIISFNAGSNHFNEVHLSNRDELLAAEAEKYVAVVITSNRLFGLTADKSTFFELRLRSKETVESLKITASKAVVQTTERLLTFEAKGSTWREYRL